MIIKIKDGTVLTIDGKKYTVNGTSLYDLHHNGASRKASFTAANDLEEITVEFDQWSIAISERDLDGLSMLLTTG